MGGSVMTLELTLLRVAPPLGGDVALSSTTESSATVDSHETVTRRASRDACDNQMRVTCESPRG